MNGYGKIRRCFERDGRHARSPSTGRDGRGGGQRPCHVRGGTGRAAPLLPPARLRLPVPRPHQTPSPPPARPGPHRLGGRERTHEPMNFSSWPPLLVVDVEGNGVNPPDLVEVAALPVREGRPDTSTAGAWLTKPRHPVTPFAARVNGLTNERLENEPGWEEIADQVHTLLGTSWICAHNAHVDHRVLCAHLPTWQPTGVIDTLRLAKATHPGLPKYTRRPDRPPPAGPDRSPRTPPPRHLRHLRHRPAPDHHGWPLRHLGPARRCGSAARPARSPRTRQGTHPVVTAPQPIRIGIMGTRSTGKTTLLKHQDGLRAQGFPRSASRFPSRPVRATLPPHAEPDTLTRAATPAMG